MRIARREVTEGAIFHLKFTECRFGAGTCTSLFSLVTCLSVSGSGVPPGLRVSAVALVMSGGRPPGDGASERSGRGSLFQSLLHGHHSLSAGVTSAASEISAPNVVNIRSTYTLHTRAVRCQ